MSGQRTLSLEMREFDPTDYPRLLEIYNANYPDYARSVVEWRSRDETVDRSKYYWQRYSFLERNAIVGFGDVSHVTKSNYRISLQEGVSLPIVLRPVHGFISRTPLHNAASVIRIVRVVDFQ